MKVSFNGSGAVNGLWPWGVSRLKSLLFGTEVVLRIRILIVALNIRIGTALIERGSCIHRNTWIEAGSLVYGIGLVDTGNRIQLRRGIVKFDIGLCFLFNLYLIITIIKVLLYLGFLLNHCFVLAL